MIRMKKLSLDKNLKSSLITYGMVIVFYIVMQALVMTGNISSLMKGLLVPLCIYSIMAVSLNLTVGILGELSLGHAGFMCIGAFAGALLCSAYPSLSPYVGSMPGIKAFVAAVFGGIGSIPGAMIGGILLGVIENLSKAYISSQLSDAIVFGVLIVVLLVKPTGILGKNIQEKV